MRIPALVVLTVTTSIAAAQTGTVTGHILCADTQRPARFAHGSLLGVPLPPPTRGQHNTTAQASGVDYEDTRRIEFLSDVDGAFNLTGVAPGDYYVFGVVPGYLQPRSLVERAITDGADPTKSVPGVPRIHVIADRTSQAEVLLQRGASISGHVNWDDGSPVIMANIIPVRLQTDGKPSKELGLPFAYLSGGVSATFTSETGGFHFSALAPGDYLIKANVYTGGSVNDSGAGTKNNRGLLLAQSITVFAPSSFHRSDAKLITLLAGEERNDIDITFRLADLRTISGSASSSEDHHPITSGRIKLEDAVDKDFTRTSALDESGNFAITFVPPGTYTLTITEAADDSPTSLKFPANVLRSYDNAQKTIILTNSTITRQDFELTPSARIKLHSNTFD